jgi:DNA-binding MarR family transcriptional regulator
MEPAPILQKFGKLRRLLNAKLSQELRQFEIGPTQGLLLRTIRRLNSCSLAELSRETQTDPAATGKSVDSLIRQAWVKKQKHPTDRRQWIVSLTREGKLMTRKLDPIWDQTARALVFPLNQKERSEFHRMLSLAEEHLERSLDTGRKDEQ